MGNTFEDGNCCLKVFFGRPNSPLSLKHKEAEEGIPATIEKADGYIECLINIDSQDDDDGISNIVGRLIIKNGSEPEHYSFKIAYYPKSICCWILKLEKIQVPDEQEPH